MKSKWFRRVLFFVSFLLVVYVTSYISRRDAGSYRMAQSGEIRLSGGLAIYDIELWNPEGCWWQSSFRDVRGEIRSRGNGWGRFYAPLIEFDRKFNFKDRVTSVGD